MDEKKKTREHRRIMKLDKKFGLRYDKVRLNRIARQKAKSTPEPATEPGRTYSEYLDQSADHLKHCNLLYPSIVMDALKFSGYENLISSACTYTVRRKIVLSMIDNNSVESLQEVFGVDLTAVKNLIDDFRRRNIYEVFYSSICDELFVGCLFRLYSNSSDVQWIIKMVFQQTTYSTSDRGSNNIDAVKSECEDLKRQVNEVTHSIEPIIYVNQMSQQYLKRSSPEMILARGIMESYLTPVETRIINKMIEVSDDKDEKYSEQINLFGLAFRIKGFMHKIDIDVFKLLYKHRVRSRDLKVMYKLIYEYVKKHGPHFRHITRDLPKGFAFPKSDDIESMFLDKTVCPLVIEYLMTKSPDGIKAIPMFTFYNFFKNDEEESRDFLQRAFPAVTLNYGDVANEY